MRSMVVSTGSSALVRMTETLSRVVAYSKLESDAYEENGIEYGAISRDATIQIQISSVHH
jgi:hypothetical protein